MSWIGIKQRNPQRKFVAMKLRTAMDDLLNQDIKGLDRIDKIYHKVDGCMSYVNMQKCIQCGMLHFNKSNYCESKLCPICAYLRARKYLSVLVPRFRNMLERGYKINFLTLTIKDTAVLKYGLDIVKKAWRYMTNRDPFSKYIFKNMFIGGIYAIEIKKGKNSKLWHPHVHLLVVKDHFSKDFDVIKGLWEMACQKVANTTEKISSVDIRGVHDKNGKLTKNINSEDTITSAVVECVKYVTKFSFDDYSSMDLLELCNCLYNNRLFSTFGCMRNSEDEDLDEDYKDVVEELVCTKCGSRDFEDEVTSIDKAMNMNVVDFGKRHYVSKKEQIAGLTAIMEVMLRREYE